MTDLIVGEEFAGHRILGHIGRGGMGVVYLAEHIRLSRKVAIKVLSPDLARDEAFRRRFVQEAKHAAALNHPYIVTVYNAADEDGRAYISMQYVDGQDLAALLHAQGAIPPQHAVAIAARVASALDDAHQHGFVHRDVKPANILLEAGDTGDFRRAFLTDFGVTKAVATDGTTEAGQFVGTIDYTAPEQILGAPLDGRADQYSLACVVFECLSGSVPFPRESRMATMFAHHQARPPSLTGNRPELDEHVDEIIRRAMAKPPEHRFDTCSEFVDALERALSGATATSDADVKAPAGRAQPGDTAPRAQTLRGRHRGGRPRRRAALLAAAVALLVTVTAVAVMETFGGNPQVGASSPSTLHTPQTSTGSRTESPPPTGSRTESPPPTGSRTESPPPTDTFPSRIDWAPVSDSHLAGVGAQNINRAAVGDSLIVAVGSQTLLGNEDAEAWISRDGGYTWSEHGPQSGWGPGTQVMSAITHTESGFVAVGTRGEAGSEDPGVWRSDDGLYWTSPGNLTGIGSQIFRRLITVDDVLIVVGTNSAAGAQEATAWVGREAPGENTDWTDVTMDTGGILHPHQEAWGVTKFGGELFAVGSTATNRGGERDVDPAVWSSLIDGSEWSTVAVSDLAEPGTQIMRAVIATENGLVAVGTDNHRAAIWTSSDGHHWIPARSPTPDVRVADITGLVQYDGGLVMVGATGPDNDRDAAIWVSPDGEHWTTDNFRAFAAPGNQTIKSVVQYEDHLIALGVDNNGDRHDAAVWVGTPVPDDNSRLPVAGPPLSGP